MAFVSSNKILGFCKLFHLALIAWTLVSCQTKPTVEFTYKKVGSSYNLTCPGDLSKNYTFTFYLNSRKVVLDDETKQVRSALTIIKLGFKDAGNYYCVVQNETGNQINKVKLGALFVVKVQNVLKMYPETAKVHSVKEGESFVFKCEYNKPSIPIIWWKVIDGNMTRISRDKITVINGTKDSQEVYTFKKVTADDEGTYLCQVNDKETKYSEKHVLEVKVNKRPSFQDVKDVFYIEEEEDLLLKVHLGVQGTPFPNITCFKGRKKVIFCAGEELANVSADRTVCKNGDYELTGYTAFVIDYISFLKHGVYTCLATNVYGLDNVTFSVDVAVRPSISKGNSEFFFEKENKVGSVTCTIKEANPKPEIVWFQQDMVDIRAKPKPDNWTQSSFASKLNDLHGGRYEGILTVPWNKPDTFFMCNATNKVGCDSRIYKFIRLLKDQEPFVVRTSNPVKNEEETFTAECRITITIPGDFVFYKVDSEKVIKNDTRTKITRRYDDKFHYLNMRITNLTVNDSGTYQCTESTKLSNQKASVTLIVKAFRPAIITSLQNRTVLYPKDNSVVLFCNVSGNPPPEVTWSRKGESLITNTLTVQNCKKLVRGYYYQEHDHRRTKLVICQPNLLYTGVYTCFAKNKLQNDTRNAYLDVLAPPTIDQPRTLQKERLDIGAKITITCKASGNPFPLVQWIKIGEEKPVSTPSISSSSLQINDMDKSYVGNYSCKARNYLGFDKKTLLELQLPLPDLKPEESSGGMQTGTIIGIAIGIGIFVVIMVSAGVLWQRRQQKKLIFYKHQYFLKTGQFNVDPSRTLNEQCLSLPYDSDWEFPYERLVVGERLGAGAFGEVYKAEAIGILYLNARDKSGTANKRRSKLRHSLRANLESKNRLSLSGASNAIVALKTLKASATENEIRDLAAELKLMIHVGAHKNIVNLLGACTTRQQLYVILEFCPYGDLLLFLRSKRDIYRNTWHKEVFDREKEFTLTDLVAAAYQVAKGMEFLASQKLIHRDLAARNILVADEYVMKISDFGLARDIYKDDVYVKTSSGLLPVKWMAIESLFDRVYTHQSDVWSFGVLLWEMMTLGGTPYPGLAAEDLLDYLHNGKRMPQPDKCPLEVYTIMRDCWLEEPEQRPTFANLVEHFGRILEKHLDKENQYLQVEATQEEIEAAKERDLLLKPKSDYLEPLIITNKQQGYDANAALPTPPTDAVTPTYSNPSYNTLPQAMLNFEAATPKMRHTDSCERLREDIEEEGPNPPRASSDNESGIGLEDMNGENRDEQDELETPAHIETVL